MAPLKTILALLVLFLSLVMGDGDHSGVQDVTSMLSTSSGIRITDSSKKIIDTMASVAQLPSCNKMASAALINTCSELDIDSALGLGETVDAMLEKSKSIYAARLAICELSDAHAYVPDACSVFRPTEKSTWKSYLMPGRRTQHPIYEHNTIKDLDRCLKALSSKPQSWTSFSNAKQNAIIMCHAMRASIDKDEKLEIFHMVAELNRETMGAMTAATRDFEAFLKDFAVIRRDMQSFQMSVNEGAIDVTDRLEAFWANLNGNIDNLDHNINTMLQTTHQASTDLVAYQSQSEFLHAAAIKTLMAMVATIQDTKNSSETALDLQNDLNKNLIDALNFTLAAARSASSVDMLMSDLVQRLNDTIEVAENLHWLISPPRLISAFSQSIRHFILGDVFTSSSGPLKWLGLSGFFAICYTRRHGYNTPCSIVASMLIAVFTLRILGPMLGQCFATALHYLTVIWESNVRFITWATIGGYNRMPHWAQIVFVTWFILNWFTAILAIIFIFSHRYHTGIWPGNWPGLHKPDDGLVRNRHWPGHVHKSEPVYRPGVQDVNRIPVRLPINDPRYFTEGRGRRGRQPIVVSHV